MYIFVFQIQFRYKTSYCNMNLNDKTRTKYITRKTGIPSFLVTSIRMFIIKNRDVGRREAGGAPSPRFWLANTPFPQIFRPSDIPVDGNLKIRNDQHFHQKMFFIYFLKYGFCKKSLRQNATLNS